MLNIPIWKCKTCGCLWRDNLDGAVSLFDAEQKSCSQCEPLPVREACDIHWIKVRTEAQLQAQDEAGWQPIETAPRDGRWLLVVDHSQIAGDGITLARFDSDLGINLWYSGLDAGYEDDEPLKPSHWMPLPKGPNNE